MKTSTIEITLEQWQTIAEVLIWASQQVQIEEEFGLEAAHKANYGWGTDQAEECFDVATKVYGHGVLVSTMHFPGLEPIHAWRE